MCVCVCVFEYLYCICSRHFHVTFQCTWNYIMLWYPHYMNQFCTCIFCVLYDSYSVNDFICLLFVLVWCKLSEVDLKKIETCRSLSGLYMKVCFSIFVHFWYYLLIYIYKYLKNAKMHKCIYIFIHSVFCLTTGPKPPPKRFLHIVRSRASPFKWEYPLLSLRSASSLLRLLPTSSSSSSCHCHLSL